MGSPVTLIAGGIGLGLGAEAIKGFTIVVPSKRALDAVNEVVQNNPDPATRAEELKKLFAGNFELQKMFIEWQY
jgi:hypothetical protein